MNIDTAGILALEELHKELLIHEAQVRQVTCTAF
jgi:low affinity sulfate transporter 2